VLEALGARATWYRRESVTSHAKLASHVSLARRGPAARAASEREQGTILAAAKAFPWYGYKKIALICHRLDEPIPRRKVYRVMKEAGLLHRLKKRIDERARQETARLYQLLPKRPNELWQTDVTYIPIPGYSGAPGVVRGHGDRLPFCLGSRS